MKLVATSQIYTFWTVGISTTESELTGRNIKLPEVLAITLRHVDYLGQILTAGSGTDFYYF